MKKLVHLILFLFLLSGCLSDPVSCLANAQEYAENTGGKMLNCSGSSFLANFNCDVITKGGQIYKIYCDEISCRRSVY